MAPAIRWNEAPASLRDDDSGDRGMLVCRKKRHASKVAALLGAGWCTLRVRIFRKWTAW